MTPTIPITTTTVVQHLYRTMRVTLLIDDAPSHILIATGFNDEYMDQVEILDLNSTFSCPSSFQMAAYPVQVDGSVALRYNGNVVVCSGWNGTYNGDCYSYISDDNKWNKESFGLPPKAFGKLGWIFRFVKSCSARRQKFKTSLCYDNNIDKVQKSNFKPQITFRSLVLHNAVITPLTQPCPWRSETAFGWFWGAEPTASL